MTFHKRIWRDYMGGTIEKEKVGQRQYFYADLYNEAGDHIGLDSCFREARREGKIITYFGPGYSDYGSTVVTVDEAEFAAWDDWHKKEQIRSK